MSTTATFQNRQQRRAAAAEFRRQQKHVSTTEAVGDQGWDDLRRLYGECQALSVVPSQVLPLLKDQERLAKIQDMPSLVEQSKVLQKDVGHYNARLADIYGRHAERSGSTQDPDDLMYCITLGEEYQNWLHSYQSVVIPTVQNILQMFTDESLALEGEYVPATAG